MRSAFLITGAPSALCLLLHAVTLVEVHRVGTRALPEQARRADAAKPVPMREVVLLGIMRPEQREVSAQVIATIGTPIGNIPIRGRILLRVACAGTFRGTITYHPMVRFFARLKGVDLISDVDGAIEPQHVESCATLPADSIRGKALVEKTHLRGALSLAGDSVRFAGPTWMVGDSTYHGLLRVTRGTALMDIHVNLYERGKAPRPPS
jgi:hypothetical protein